MSLFFFGGGGLPEKAGPEQFADLRGRGGLGKKEGGSVFDRELIPQCTL